jgi:hypothetical protein
MIRRMKHLVMILVISPALAVVIAAGLNIAPASKPPAFPMYLMDVHDAPEAPIFDLEKRKVQIDSKYFNNL